MDLRKYFPAILTLLLVCVCIINADAQCQMCKSTAEQSNYAKSLNQGIEYLLLAPVVILGTVLFIWIRNKDDFSVKQ